MVSEGKVRVGKRATDFLLNRGYEVKETVLEIFEAMNDSHFQKTIDLKNRPGTKADVYVAEYEDEKWYVKFFHNSDDEYARIEVWSCNWDGCMH